ncbi:TolB family protein [Cytophaga aurantiaca]|uniref:TolB family protein n=1 Tax=Cytophaga aurantiaca TaxID=29530 RepID=UPI00036AED65|nr:TolB family protein [Cytophaga aurantiaca]
MFLRLAFLISIPCFLLSCQLEKTEEVVLVQSTLEIFSLDSGTRQVIYQADGNFEAPNWSRDGSFLLFNMKGEIYRISPAGGNPVKVNTDFATRCNNDHGISPDNTELVISHHEKESGKSMIYVLPIEGGEPKLITPNAPSYWHGWSPDGNTLAYCAERNGEYDIYTIPAKGGQEIQLTIAKGLDDGPDYTADGKYIYFNSVRSGKMKIWRMKPDGSDQEQVTFDEYNDWFAHPSPDGKYIVFVSYAPEVEGHPANKDVTLRLMPIDGGEPKVIAKLFGGQGTINVPSWSPDSRRFAFVSYKLLN